MEKKLNFKRIAQKEVSLAEVMIGREKIDTDEIMNQFPDGFTIDEIEYATMKKGTNEESFWVFHIAGTNYFAFAGTILSKIFERFLAECEGSYDDLYEAFRADAEGLHVKLSPAETKEGRDLTKVEIL